MDGGYGNTSRHSHLFLLTTALLFGVVPYFMNTASAQSSAEPPTVFPNQILLVGPESSQQIVVTQRLNDERQADLTRTVTYQSTNK